MHAASPVKAILQTLADGAEVSGVSHYGAVQRVVLQIYRYCECLGYIWGTNTNKIKPSKGQENKVRLYFTAKLQSIL